jgi:hypothetical protein
MARIQHYRSLTRISTTASSRFDSLGGLTLALPQRGPIMPLHCLDLLRRKPPIREFCMREVWLVRGNPYKFDAAHG